MGRSPSQAQGEQCCAPTKKRAGQDAGIEEGFLAEKRARNDGFVLVRRQNAGSGEDPTCNSGMWGTRPFVVLRIKPSPHFLVAGGGGACGAGVFYVGVEPRIHFPKHVQDRFTGGVAVGFEGQQNKADRCALSF
jgi:hypothetical protein